MHNYIQAPPVPQSDQRPHFAQQSTRKLHRDGTLYATVADPVPVYQEVDESIGYVYDYARHDTDFKDILDHIKSNKKREEAVHNGVSPREAGKEGVAEEDGSHDLDEDKPNREDSDEEDGYVVTSRSPN